MNSEFGISVSRFAGLIQLNRCRDSGTIIQNLKLNFLHDLFFNIFFPINLIKLHKCDGGKPENIHNYAGGCTNLTKTALHVEDFVV